MAVVSLASEAASRGPRAVSFSEWTQQRSVPSMGTNSGATSLAFQKWRHFKEAFTPELVAKAVLESPVQVRNCLDPFGGSGTTALACQFLGVNPTTIEVNPYLADLIEAKLTSYDADALVATLGRVLRSAARRRGEAGLALPEFAPPTLVEPGKRDRWVFDQEVASRLGALLSAITRIKDLDAKRLFTVLLGGVLLEVSNVVVNGKGRRYRRNWRNNRRAPKKVEQLFAAAVRQAISDIRGFGRRAQLSFQVVRGDARRELNNLSNFDLAVFSPPYPNSFDYTDVYNLELWTLGYLLDRQDNRHLRGSTLCSHVQLERDYPAAPSGSHTLSSVLDRLRAKHEDLWHKRIPDMVAGYFADLAGVLGDCRRALREQGRVWVVVGDSRYAEVAVPTSTILRELAPRKGLEVVNVEPFRSMRASAQQGGQRALQESLVVLKPLPGM